MNIIKADIISRFGGKWPSQYREGWLPLVPLYTTGTAAFTQGSRTVTGSGTTWLNGGTDWTSAKILGSDGAYYKVLSVQSDTSLTISQPFQGTTNLTATYQIWQDEYVLYPEVLSIGGFVDYGLRATMSEAFPRNMKLSYPVPTNVELPNVYTVIGRKTIKNTYSTGSVSGTINTNTLTGSGTSWLSNLDAGGEMLIGTIKYHVRRIISDTSLELYQLLTSTLTNSAYSYTGKNALIVRFREPTNQEIVNYWYNAKSYSLVNDNDEDWVCEMYPETINIGAVVKDYLDKNDVARAGFSKNNYEGAIKDMMVSETGAMTGVRTIAYDIPPEARD